MNLKLGLILSSSIFAIAFSAGAENRQIGRNSDGSAYRVDKEGNEIVDYIAELEVAKDSLERQVRGLQSELEEKNRILSSQRANPESVTERDLTKASSAHTDTARPSIDCSVAISRARAEGIKDGESRAIADSESSAARLREAALDEANSLKAQLRAAKDSISVRDAELQSRSAELEALRSDQVKVADSRSAAQLKRLASELESVRGTLRERENELSSLNVKVAQLTSVSSELTSARQELTVLRQRVATQDSQLQELRDVSSSSKSLEEEAQLLRGKVGNLEREIALRDAELKSARAELQSANVQFATGRVAPRAESEAATRTEVSYEPPRAMMDSKVVMSGTVGTEEAVTPARQRAVDSVRGRINTDLNELKNLIRQRDALFAEYMSSSPRLVLRKTSAVSERGIGVQEITGRLRAITSMLELSSLSRDIREIGAKVQEDINVVNRMRKVR